MKRNDIKKTAYPQWIGKFNSKGLTLSAADASVVFHREKLSLK